MYMSFIKLVSFFETTKALQYRSLKPETIKAIELLDSVLNDNFKLSKLLSTEPKIFSARDKARMNLTVSEKE